MAPFGLPECQRCKAVGTIVQMGKCCRVRELDAKWVMRALKEAKRRLGLPPRRRAA